MSAWTARSFLPARPVGAFLLLGLGLAAVGARVVVSQLALAAEEVDAIDELAEPNERALELELDELPSTLEERVHTPQPHRPIVLTSLAFAEPPLHELVDREGETLALSVRGHALEASPFHLWLVHTPDTLLPKLRDVLGDQAPRDLERRLLGTDEFGWRSVNEWHLLPHEAHALADWIRAGGPTRYPDIGPLPGLALEPCRLVDGADGIEGMDGTVFRVRWNPSLLLSPETRRRIDRDLLDDKEVTAARWVRALSVELWQRLAGPRERHLAALFAKDAKPPPGWELVPPPSGLGKLLERWIQPPTSWRVSAAVPQWQFAQTQREWVFGGLFESRYERICPNLETTRVDAVRALLESEHVGGFQIWLRPTSERRYPQGRHALLGRVGWLRDDVSRRHGRWGLEHAAEAALARLGLVRPGEVDSFVRRVLVRVRAQDQEYYGDHAAGVQPPRVVTTIDARLQERLALALERIESEHSTSLTMGIVIDLESRDVLALDWRDPYELGTYAPVQHGFTPGSTFKVVTMALALDAGVVSPHDVFDVGNGAFLVPGTRRVVGEAEGFATGRITAADCLARSSNAGMIQIGLMLSPETWRTRAAQLGYGRPAGGDLVAFDMLNFAGSVGEIPSGPNDNTWARARSHTSVCFGDSLSLNLLQHATAVSAIVSDGRLRPLRFLDAIENNDGRVQLPASEGPQVLRRETCDKILAMMRLGADEGTGKRIARPDGLVLATKTGTYEKLRSDISYHVLGRALAEARASGETWSGSAAYRRHRGDWDGRRGAYTSSIVVVGQVEGSTRRVLVYLVAEDPIGKERFGSYVTGDAAAQVVAAALGLEDGEARRLAVLGSGLPRLAGPAVASADELPERPWEAVGR